MNGVDEVYRLASDLSGVSARMVPPLRSAMLLRGNQFAAKWADNARVTSGTHGRLYPDSITAELAFTISSISVDVGPDESKPQGGMGPGFEFGSVNQPPHLDGKKAADTVTPDIERAIDAAVHGLMP